MIRQHAEKDPEKLFTVSSAFRHALVHGRRLQVVEEEQGVEISDVVDSLGRAAWRALSGLLIPMTATHDRPIRFLLPGTFLHRRLALTAVGSFSTPTDREPQLEDLPVGEITLHREQLAAPPPERV